MTDSIAPTAGPARDCPFVGTRPFQYGEDLFGRDREVKRLRDLLIAERIVLLFSPSGAGKTSLIQAGLIPGLRDEIPGLRDEGFHDLPIIRVKQPPSTAGDGPHRVTTNRFIRAALTSLDGPRLESPGESDAPGAHPPAGPGRIDALGPALALWSDALRPGNGARPPRLVLIFDQFEEILTTDPTDVRAKQEFFVELGGVLKVNRGLWALFAMREEFVAALEPYLDYIPRRLSSRFRLDLLDADAARQAFEQPFKSRGISVTPDFADEIIADLSAVQIQGSDGKPRKAVGRYVEPAHLQIVGLDYWNRFAGKSGFDRLDKTHIGGTEGSVDDVLASYYAGRVEEIGKTTGVGERSVREWCESQLLTDNGLRGQVIREPDITRGLPNVAIQKLIDAFLVREEDRRGSIWYELAHDRLIEPVLKSNRSWRDRRLHPSLSRASAWDKADRPASLLFRDRELSEVETWAKDNSAILSEVEREFLGDSRAAWDEEQSRLEEEQRQRTREVILWGAIAGVVVLLAVSSAIGILAWRAVSAGNEARRHENVARRAALEAERLTADLTIDHGISLCQQGRVDDGLLWLIRGLVKAHKSEPFDPFLDHLVRLELATWSAELTRLRRFQRSSHRVFAVASSPDGRTAITGGEDGTVGVWDLDSGLSKESTLRHDGAVLAVAIARDGRTAITGGEDGAARLWDLASGRLDPRGPALRHEGPVDAVAISPDGRTAITGSLDETARLWDAGSGRPIVPPLKHAGWIKGVSLSDDGQTARTVTWDFSGQTWNFATGQPAVPTRRYEYPVSAVGFGPDNATALIGGWNGEVWDWNLAFDQVAGPLLRHDGAVLALAISPDGRTAITSSWDRTARLYELASRRVMGPPLKHESGILAVALGPDGRTAITSSWDKVVRLWDVAPGQRSGPPLPHDAPIYAAVFSPDGHTAITGTSMIGDIEGAVWEWDFDSGQLRKKTLLKFDLPIELMALSPDGRAAITLDQYGRATRWDLDSGKAKEPPVAGVSAMAFSPDGRTAIIGSFDGSASLWDLGSGVRTEVLRKRTGAVLAVAIAQDGRTAITGGEDGSARLCDLATGEIEGNSLKHDGPVGAVTLSRDGRTAATGSWDGTARVWDVQEQRPIGLPLDIGGQVMSVAVSPDGTLVLTSSTNGTTQLWTAGVRPGAMTAGVRQRAIGAPFPPGSLVPAMAFSPDGRSIMTGMGAPTARIWRTPTAVKDPADRLGLWIRVLTRKELLPSDEIRTIDLEAWRKDRDELIRRGGLPDEPTADGATATSPR